MESTNLKKKDWWNPLCRLCILSLYMKREVVNFVKSAVCHYSYNGLFPTIKSHIRPCECLRMSGSTPDCISDDFQVVLYTPDPLRLGKYILEFPQERENIFDFTVKVFIFLIPCQVFVDCTYPFQLV